MKQPQLGHKILELRKAKGFTQEELVEKCNLNVRTLQRIEAGEVSPRSHTIRTIFEVLGFEYQEELNLEPGEILKSLQRGLPHPMLKPDPSFKKILGFSLFAGGIYFVLVFFEMGMDVSLLKDEVPPVSPTWYVLIKLLVMIGFCFFIRGFYLLGEKLENTWLKTASLCYILIFGLTIISDLLMLFRPAGPLDYILASKSILYGLGLLLFSLSLLGTQKVLGSLALVTGALGIANGVLFTTVILALPAILLLTWVELLQLVLLFKARLLFGKKSTNQRIMAELAE
jgi:transcriptional regulator with XRE-family HTH domain